MGQASVGSNAADRVFQVVALGSLSRSGAPETATAMVCGCRERRININDHHAPGIDQDEQTT